ncbi:hypothetical protein P7H17_24060 [Paenibacillus larvae]|nr:hypothetical protein [Paenibacillus larvae]MDT2288507.1 hypothetical protein [Paenibacillus larvae]
MSKTKEIHVGFIYQEFRNYENLKVDAAVTMSVDPEDDVEEVYTRAWANVKNQIRKGLLR